MKIALHACTDEVQVYWSADYDVCGSPSRGEKDGDTNCVSGETRDVIGSGTNTGVRSCLRACPVAVSVAVGMFDQQERLPVLHNATLLWVGCPLHHPALTSICR